MIPPHIDIHAMARTLGGRVVRGNVIECPGPSRKKNSTSLTIWVDDKHPEGFSVYSHTGRTFQEARDYVRETAGLPTWKPNGREQVQPVFPAKEYIYFGADGIEHHRVDALSDGSFRHYHYYIDGWLNGPPDLLIPFALSDTQSDETIWLVRGEYHAQLIRDGFMQVATTYPSGLDVHADASFLHYLDGKDVRILDVGGAQSQEFCSKFSEALNLPVYKLPPSARTLIEFASHPDASLGQCEPASEPQKLVFIPTPFELGDPTQISPRQWIYDFRLIRGFVSLTVAPGGLGKSSLAMVDSLAMAIGRPLFDDSPVQEKKSLRVWYWNGEDPQEETRRRIAAIALHYKVKNTDIGGRLFTDTGRETEIILGNMDGQEITVNETLFTDLEKTILANRIDVLMIDPFSSAHRLPENDNSAINAIARRLAKLADRCNCAVEIVHHTRKTNGAETTVEDGRGASSMRDAVRSARALNVMSYEDFGRDLGISEDECKSYFSVGEGKASMSSRASGVKWRRLVSVPLGNATVDRDEDTVGVVTYYELKKPDESVEKTNNLAELETTLIDIVRQNDMTRHWPGRGVPPKGWLGKVAMDRMGLINVANGKVNQVIKNLLNDGKIILRQSRDNGNEMSCYALPGSSERADNADPPDSNDLPF